MLFQQMQELAAEMKFEEAQKIKKKYLLLENYRAQSEVVSLSLIHIWQAGPPRPTSPAESGDSTPPQ